MVAIIVSILGEVNYMVVLSGCRIWHRHIEQMIKRHSHSENDEIPVVDPVDAGIPLKDMGAPLS